MNPHNINPFGLYVDVLARSRIRPNNKKMTKNEIKKLKRV